MTPAELIAFEDRVCAAFNAGKIRAPIHLSHGNERELVELFNPVMREDWVFSNWRSHYHCLLKGVPPDELMEAILAGRSIALCFPEHRIISSAIVGGTLPIALGTALAIKRKGGLNRVHCFVGDMTARTGIYTEVSRYAVNHMLPMNFVIEDDGRSVCTDTKKAWGEGLPAIIDGGADFSYYRYENKYPHAGTGTRINF